MSCKFPCRCLRSSDSPVVARSVASFLIVLAVSAMGACGSGTSASAAPSSPASVTVSVSPTSATVQTAATQQFQATVTGSTNTAVTWSVDGVAGGSATTGTVSTVGLYTAPSTAGQHTVTATSAANTSDSGSATVTVTATAPPPPVVTVTVSPTTASIVTGATQQFQAAVTGTTNTAVTWSVDGVTGGGATVGTVSTTGLYTAPATAGQHTVTATSAASTSASGSATVAVTATTAPPVVAVTISPTIASIQTGATQQFQASVTGTTNTAVTWSVDTVIGGNAAVGTVSATGLYTAPATAGAHSVTATSVADTTKSASAAVTVTAPPVTITISPTSASIAADTTQQFADTVTGTTNTAATWSVDGIIGGSTAVGTISGTGLYAAPTTTGTHTVTVTSSAAPTVSASAAVTITATLVVITISPTTASVPVSTPYQFSPTITGTTNMAVTWSVDSVVGGNTTVGTISSTGLYTAPATTGTHTVTVTSNAAPTQSASAAVTVTPAAEATVAADFGNRTSTTHFIPSEILGAEYSNPMSSEAITSIYNGGFRLLRLHSMIQTVYASKSPNWSFLDQFLDVFKSVNVGKTPGLKVMLQLTYTPPWLVPTLTGCPAPGSADAFKVPPTDVNTWATLVQSIVAHVDQKYPGLVTDYEIWNEPDLGTFCVSPNTGANRASEYLALYAAAAPLIRAQAAKDNATVRIGGPTIISEGAISFFVTGILDNPSTAPYVDFVSYHKYPSGITDVTGGMLWDQPSATGLQSLYSRTQSPASGFGPAYLAFANAVKSGQQANPTKTKIYMDEYNTNWAFSDDCCRNSTTYSPLFNGLVMVDMLDSVYKGASHVPDSLMYFSSSNSPFCLIGDAGGHCGATNFSVMYPQYYLYSMFASSNYLDLSTAGGYMANSVSPLPSSTGLAATAFWSAGQDSIVIVNPTDVSYSSVSVVAKNPGFTVGSVTEYLLNSANESITSSTLAPSSTMNVNIPAYSVIGLKITQ